MWDYQISLIQTHEGVKSEDNSNIYEPDFIDFVLFKVNVSMSDSQTPE